jgi:catechol 2,3-dioxygenase-like lactoylglutathione lyase family enzyme
MTTFKGVTPILRMFDVQKAKEFYLDYLGFHLDWEHRFEEDLPLYMQISWNGFVIHLSEHFGDCNPGGAIRVEIEGLEIYHQELVKKRYKYSRPGIEITPWLSKEVCMMDPFGNRIIFFESLNPSTKGE